MPNNVDSSNNFKIKTPHAAVLVWNYIDRISAPSTGSDTQASGVTNLDDTEPTILSTLSCISIQTNKSKGQPAGTFDLVLAPTKNWVSTLTAGSWICILMSNEPITQNDLKKANKRQVKMIGKIETVRVDTSMGDDGARNTRFHVSGVDWAHVFNNVIYVDNLIASANDPVSQGNAVAVALRNLLFASDGTPKSFLVKDNLRSLINVFGQTIEGIEKNGSDINRLAGALYNFRMPKAMVEFFKFVGPDGNVSAKERRLNKVLNLVTGKFTDEGEYTPTNEAKGFIDPFSLQGQHTFWQVLMENSNPVLNEMFAEMNWSGDTDSDMSLQLTVFNRIKPFSYKDFDPSAGAGRDIASYFQLCPMHDIDPVEVMSINAGTNWRDKFNFVEIKPNFSDFNVIANWYKQKSQAFDAKAFEREGFRPLILETKQFPSGYEKPGGNFVDWDQLLNWVKLLREWYFNTHKMLNGTIVLHGQTDYIAVGDNIRFDAGLVNPTPNFNRNSIDNQENPYILAHVENISHSFGVSGDGSRSYTTTIQFVRGILVNEDNISSGMGPLDDDASKVGINNSERNTLNVNSTSDPSDPDSVKIRGN